MARETQPPPSSGLPGRLHGLGRRAPTVAFHGDPRVGAADMAPTAPHATPPETPDRKSGPARFWSKRRIRIALTIASVLSLVFHGYIAPFGLIPDRSGIELKDVEGELTIPIDLLGEEAPPEEKASPPEVTPPPESDPSGAKAKADAGPRPKPDASAPDATALATDAGASPIAIDGGPTTTLSDGGAEVDGGEGDAGADGGLIAASDAGAPAGGSGPRDPGSIIGVAGLGSAGTVNVTLIVNIAVIRTNPVGARMGPLLYGIPQWNDFMQGSQTTVDPIRDTDWIMVWGPSLINTDRDAVLVHYSAPDAVVDLAVESIAKRYVAGGAFDAGVPGVKASLGHADNAERVFMRVQPHLLTIVPKDAATKFARSLKRAAISPHVRPGEAMRLIVKDPWRQISIPGLKFSNALKELRLWIVPRASDGGADVFVEGDCTDAASASDAADALTDLMRRQNSNILIRALTRGLLNNAKVTADGAQIKSHLDVSRDQLEALLQGIGSYMGVAVQPAGGGH